MRMYMNTRIGSSLHVFNQGVDRRQIFLIREDYERFKAYLYILNDAESVRPANVIARDGGGKTYTHARGERLVRIIAFSLLPTHFHILLEPLREKGVAQFMQKVITGYTMYFNARTIRTGTLFASGYKSKTLAREHVKYTRAYIHMTPMQFFHDDWTKTGAHEFDLLAGKIATYPYSSLYEYNTKSHLITDRGDASVNPRGEFRLWSKAGKEWEAYF